MPFLRVIRDKRGYETTYVMHLLRDGGRQRTRVLYVFHGPIGARVGRAALDPGIVREIEACYPEIEFDWNAVLGSQQVVELSAPVRRPRRRRSEESDEEPQVEAAAPATPDTAEVVPPAQAQAQAPAQPPRPPVPSRIEGETADEKVAFLTEWHAVLRDRVLQQVVEGERREGLLALVAQLNPAAWTDADTITTGLEDAGAALERLSMLFSRRRRRSRRGSRRTPGTGGETAGAGVEAEAGLAGGDALAEGELADADEPAEPSEQPDRTDSSS